MHFTSREYENPFLDSGSQVCRVEEHFSSLTAFLSPDAVSNALSQCVFKVAWNSQAASWGTYCSQDTVEKTRWDLTSHHTATRHLSAISVLPLFSVLQAQKSHLSPPTRWSPDHFVVSGREPRLHRAGSCWEGMARVYQHQPGSPPPSGASFLAPHVVCKYLPWRDWGRTCFSAEGEAPASELLL